MRFTWATVPSNPVSYTHLLGEHLLLSFLALTGPAQPGLHIQKIAGKALGSHRLPDALLLLSLSQEVEYRTGYLLRLHLIGRAVQVGENGHRHLPAQHRLCLLYTSSTPAPRA